MDRDTVRPVVQAARRAAQASDAPLLLAVSGGLDSMVLLHAMAEGARRSVAAVATFDHGTGAAARGAVALVAREAARLGFPVVAGCAMRDVAAGAGGREARWRRARQAFLRQVARSVGARVATAHTEDDHLETVLMRVMRGSGARGLAALAAPGLALRPFVGLRRQQLARYAAERQVEWHEDPSNADRAHLRNRVRHDLLPALRAADPALDAALLELSCRAARWREQMDLLVAKLPGVEHGTDGSLSVGAAELAGHSEDSLAVLWSALAARVGLALDHRGTRRVSAFTSSSPRAGRIPLSGGWWMAVVEGRYHLSRAAARSRSDPGQLADRLAWSDFRFRPATAAECEQSERVRGAGWWALLPTDVCPVVRAWQPGDRLLPSQGQPVRRVKRYLSEGGVRGIDREGWPVVVSGDDVVWIPGVRRSDAATVRSGRPVRHILCERTTR